MCALVTGVQTCALPICRRAQRRRFRSAAPPLPVAPPRRRGDAQRLCAAHDQGVRGLSAARSRLTPLLPLLPHIPFTSFAGCGRRRRSEEHTSELQSPMRISYAVFFLKKKKSFHIIDLLLSSVPVLI